MLEGKKMSSRWMMMGALLSMLAVILGAFGAHYLKPQISQAMLLVYKTGIQYQMYHSIALILVGILVQQNNQVLMLRHLKVAALLFLLGIGVFSGSLYVLSITGIKSIGAFTPIGGLAFIVGWIYFLLAVKEIKQN